jgi:hypothetical protein
MAGRAHETRVRQLMGTSGMSVMPVFPSAHIRARPSLDMDREKADLIPGFWQFLLAFELKR